MRKIRKLVVVFLLATCETNGAQAQEEAVFDPSIIKSFGLVDLQAGRKGPIDVSTSSRQLFGFVFLSPECPLCQNYSTVLNTLAKQYTQNLQLYGIFPGKSYSRQTIAAFVKKYGISFPVYLDANKKLTTYLGASITPEVVMLNGQGNLLYRGAVDNRMKQLGVSRIAATEHYFGDAIEQSLLKKEVAIKRTDAIGCLINDY